MRVGKGRERGRHRIRSRLQALSCQHRARCGAQTHGPRDHDLSRSWTLNWLSHPGAPVNLFFLMFIYFWQRQRQSVSRGGAEREGDTESKAASRLWAVSCQHRAMSCEIMTWAEVRMLKWLSHPGVPTIITFMYYKISVERTQLVKKMFIFIFGRDSDNASGLGAEREGDTESEAGSRLWAVSTEPDTGSNPLAMRSWPEPKSGVQLPEPPRCPITKHSRDWCYKINKPADIGNNVVGVLL